MVPSNEYSQFVTNHLSGVPLDWIVIGAFVLFVVALSLKWGTQVAAALSFAAPVAVFAFNAISTTAFVSGFAAQFSSGMSAAALAGVLFVAFFFVAFRIIGSYGMTGAYPLQATLGGISAALIVLVFWFQIPALDALWHFGPIVKAVFAEQYRLFWLIAGFLALSLARR